jgi:hypothetical protein
MGPRRDAMPPMTSMPGLPLYRCGARRDASGEGDGTTAHRRLATALLVALLATAVLVALVATAGVAVVALAQAGSATG